MVKVIVEKSTESSNGGFINKLVNKTTKVVDVLGVKKTAEINRTYYIKTDEQVAEGLETEIDLTQFDVVLRPFTAPDGTEMQLKWLHVS